MRARHRLSKLLLRHGIVYSGGQAWTGKHDAWLRHEAPPQLTAVAATRLTFESDYETVADGQGPPGPARRRDRRRWPPTREFTPLVRRLGCLRGISTLTGFALAVEIGDWHRFTGNTIGSFVGLVPSEYSSGPVPSAGLDHQDRQHPRPPAAGRGRLAPPRPLRRRQDHARPLGPGPGRRTCPRRRGQPAAARTAGSGSSSDANATRSPTSRSPASSPAGAGPWPSSRSSPPRSASSTSAVVAARGATRETPMSSARSRAATLDARHAVPLLPNTPSCGNQPAHISLTARRQRHAHHRPTTTKHEAPAPSTPGRAPHPAP